MRMPHLSFGALSGTLHRTSILLAAGLLLVGGNAGGETSYLYIESNAAGVPQQNAVLAYSNDGFGNLTPLPGSPYLTGGTGFNGDGSSELNCDQQVVTDAAARTLYAVNGGSNSIAAFAINSDGTLNPLRGSPFPSGGRNPVSIGLAKGFLVVANKALTTEQGAHGDVPNYRTFAVSANGTPRMNPGSRLDLPVGSGHGSPAAHAGPARRSQRARGRVREAAVDEHRRPARAAGPVARLSRAGAARVADHDRGTARRHEG